MAYNIKQAIPSVIPNEEHIASMHSDDKAILKQNLPTFVTDLSLPLVQAFLTRAGILTADNIEEANAHSPFSYLFLQINNRPNNLKANLYFMQALQGRGPNAFSEFYNALIDTNQNDLAKLLEESPRIKELPQTSADRPKHRPKWASDHNQRVCAEFASKYERVLLDVKLDVVARLMPVVLIEVQFDNYKRGDDRFIEVGDTFDHLALIDMIVSRDRKY